MKNNIDPNVIIKGVATLAGLYLVYKVLQKVGVVPTAAANAAQQNLQQLEAANYWDYNNFFATAPAGHALLTMAGAYTLPAVIKLPPVMLPVTFNALITLPLKLN